MFFHNEDISLKHVPASKRPAHLTNIFSASETVFGWDCSGFEASVSYKVELAVWKAMGRLFGVPDFVVNMICFPRVKINARGLRYDGPHSRRSGDYWTSLSNSLINLALQYHGAYATKNAVNHVIVEGDDCLVSY